MLEALDFLLKRRSIKAVDLVLPAPNAQELQVILTAAARVPDHGKVVPFYFIVFEGDARAQAGDMIAQAYTRNNRDASADKIEAERGRFMRSPLVVAIIMRERQSKNPLWEQVLSVGAVAQNFLLACDALGYGAQWLTEWYAYDEYVRDAMGLDAHDAVAGFIYVGTALKAPEERERPDLDLIVNHWSGQNTPLKKGDVYNRDKFDFPPMGVRFSKDVSGD